MSALFSLLPGGSLTAVAVAVGVVLVALWKAFSAGKTSERLEQSQAEIEAHDIAAEIQNDIGALTPEQRRERLRKWAKR